MASIALLQFSPNRFKDRRLATSHAGKPRCRRSASNSLEVSFWEINPLSGRITAKSEIEIRPDPSEFTRPPCRLAPSAVFFNYRGGVTILRDWILLRVPHTPKLHGSCLPASLNHPNVQSLALSKVIQKTIHQLYPRGSC